MTQILCLTIDEESNGIRGHTQEDLVLAVDDDRYSFIYEADDALTSSEKRCLEWLYERGGLLELRRLSKRKLYTERLSERAYDLIFFSQPRAAGSTEQRAPSSGIRLIDLCLSEFGKNRKLPQTDDRYEQFARIVSEQQARYLAKQRTEGAKYWEKRSAKRKAPRDLDPFSKDLGAVGSATLPGFPKVSVLYARFDQTTMELHLATDEADDSGAVHVELTLMKRSGRFFGTGKIMQADRTVDSNAIVRLDLLDDDERQLRFSGEWQAHIRAEVKPFRLELDLTRLDHSV